ncbi:CS1 type fimbrial major subunit [Pseudomonas chlororaphis]|uniref:CS1 type fimbrial major subunit n=1 Tax=Pseudomonas chlororaphis TaxID=587753 RepID=UPI0030D526BC
MNIQFKLSLNGRDKMAFLKKTVLLPFAIATAAISAQAMADDPITHTIQMEAVVPSDSFSVLPTDPSWIGNTQVLSYNPNTKTLTSLVKQFTAKNTESDIHAYLLAPAVITSGDDQIPLDVKFNSKRLRVHSAVNPFNWVLHADEVAKGKVVDLEIIPQKPAGGNYAPGKYTGNVQIIFEPGGHS